jgi:hypothetical protein
VFDEFHDRLPGLLPGNTLPSGSSLDLNVHTGRQNELGKIVNCLLCGVRQINEPFVDPNLELLAGLFVHVR